LQKYYKFWTTELFTINLFIQLNIFIVNSSMD